MPSGRLSYLPMNPVSQIMEFWQVQAGNMNVGNTWEIFKSELSLAFK